MKCPLCSGTIADGEEITDIETTFNGETYNESAHLGCVKDLSSPLHHVMLRNGTPMLELTFTDAPEERPFQPIYWGGTWNPCLIIDGVDEKGYTGRTVVCDAIGALHLLNYLKKHEDAITKLASEQ